MNKPLFNTDYPQDKKLAKLYQQLTLMNWKTHLNEEREQREAKEDATNDVSDFKSDSDGRSINKGNNNNESTS